MPAGRNKKISVIRELLKLITNNFGLNYFIVFSIIFFIVRTDKDLTFEKVASQTYNFTNNDYREKKEKNLDVTIKQQNSIFSISPTDIELTGEIGSLGETPGKVRVKVGRENFLKTPKAT